MMSDNFRIGNDLSIEVNVYCQDFLKLIKKYRNIGKRNFRFLDICQSLVHILLRQNIHDMSNKIYFFTLSYDELH